MAPKLLSQNNQKMSSVTEISSLIRNIKLIVSNFNLIIINKNSFCLQLKKLILSRLSFFKAKHLNMIKLNFIQLINLYLTRCSKQHYYHDSHVLFVCHLLKILRYIDLNFSKFPPLLAKVKSMAGNEK